MILSCICLHDDDDDDGDDETERQSETFAVRWIARRWCRTGFIVWPFQDSPSLRHRMQMVCAPIYPPLCRSLRIQADCWVLSNASLFHTHVLQQPRMWLMASNHRQRRPATHSNIYTNTHTQTSTRVYRAHNTTASIHMFNFLLRDKRQTTNYRFMQWASHHAHMHGAMEWSAWFVCYFRFLTLFLKNSVCLLFSAKPKRNDSNFQNANDCLTPNCQIDGSTSISQRVILVICLRRRHLTHYARCIQVIRPLVTPYCVEMITWVNNASVIGLCLNGIGGSSRGRDKAR